MASYDRPPFKTKAHGKERAKLLSLPYIGGMHNGTPEMKVVGRKGRVRAGLEGADAMQRLLIALRKGRPFMPKGVFRFKTFEEADEWKLKMLTRR